MSIFELLWGVIFDEKAQKFTIINKKLHKSAQLMGKDRAKRGGFLGVFYGSLISRLATEGSEEHRELATNGH